jgi:hypothetical protein
MSTSHFARLSLIVALVFTTAGAVPSAAQAPVSTAEPLHRPLDLLLDLYVRDGFVYYRALKADRGRLDRYIASLNVPPATYDAWSREQKMAFWVNAYNAFVLKTVIDAYPIRGKSDGYPPNSIRQIPGAFDKLRHRAAGRTVTLDDIEKNILPEFKEPRLYLALGRGAVGSGRLRSEAYTASRVIAQLDAMQAESVRQRTIIRIDRTTDMITVTPIVGWREAEFVAAYDKGGEGGMKQRAPIERAIVTFVAQYLMPLEYEFIRQNTFKLQYHAFDWRLNDLTGGRVE